MNKERENLIKVINEIESFDWVHISLHVLDKNEYFEYKKALDIESIYYNGETWVVHTTENQDFLISEYGKKWKLYYDTDYDYETFELYDLTTKDRDDIDWC